MTSLLEYVTFTHLLGIYGANRVMKASDKATALLLVGFFLCVSVHADLVLESTVHFEAQTVVYAYTHLADVRTDTLFEPRSMPQINRCVHTAHPRHFTEILSISTATRASLI